MSRPRAHTDIEKKKSALEVLRNAKITEKSQMENGFDRLTAKEARQQRVTRSLRSMEAEANELAAFLDEQRDRRRTINIMVNTG